MPDANQTCSIGTDYNLIRRDCIHLIDKNQS